MNTFNVKLSLFLNYFLFGLLLNSVGTVILQSQRYFNVSESAASVLEGYKDISIALVSFFVASFVIKIGYKKSMQIGLALVAVACLLMASVQSYWSVKLLFALTGASFALIKISIFAVIGLIAKDQKDHASIMNFVESTFMVGILSGYFAFSYMINDSDPNSSSWFNVYYIFSALYVLAFLLLSKVKINESEIKTVKSEDKSKSSFAEMLKLLLLPVIASFLICAFFYVLIEQSIMSWLPTFNSKVLGIPSSFSVLMAGLMAGSTALGRFIFGFVSKRISWIYLLSFCILIEIVMVAITLPLAENATSTVIETWTDIPLVAYLFPLIGFFLAPIYPMINSVLLASLPKSKHASMSGLIVVFSALGGTIGSLLTGLIFQYYGGLTAFYFSIAPSCCLLTLLLIYYRYQRKLVPLSE